MLKDSFAKAFGNIESEVKLMKEQIAKFYTDTNYSLDERWDFFCSVPHVLQEESSWILDLTNFEKKHGEILWYDLGYMERNTTVNLTDFLEYRGAENWADEKKNDFKEAVLEEGYHTFVFDW